MIWLADLTAQYHSIKKEIDSAVLPTLKSGNFIPGPAVIKFEEDVASYLGAKFGVWLAFATDALVFTQKTRCFGDAGMVATNSASLVE
jgi:dTDP-4-amino-4,6-dideoxygalactose transaminase